MTFPKNIKIVDQIYDIIYVDSLIDSSKCGQTNFDSHTIEVYKPKNFSETEVWNTIFHEALHVIIEVFKIDEISETKLEEKIVHFLATGINVMMIDNKFCFKK